MDKVFLKHSRAIASYLHIFVSIFQLSFIYTPVHDIPGMFKVVQFVSTPLLFISGAWLVWCKRALIKLHYNTLIGDHKTSQE